MEKLDDYPALVDAIWKIVQGTLEERERVDFAFSEQDIVASLGIQYSWESDACVFGVAQAISDLVALEYCKGRATYNGHRWSWISPSPNSPDVLPSQKFLTPPIEKLSPFRSHALRFIHEQTICHEENITFFRQDGRFLVEDIIHVLIPVSGPAEVYTARGQVFEAMDDLKQKGFITGSIGFGAFRLWVTFKGACWLQVGQQLLKLMERATQLTTHHEVLEAVQILMNAYSEAESKAVPLLYVAVEKLENAVGGEKGLTALLDQPKTYVGDLKQSLQFHRHANTNAQLKLSYQQCLERTKEIIGIYMIRQEQH